jgi:hypothetical protein
MEKPVYAIFYWDYDAAPDGIGYYLHSVKTQYFAVSKYVNYTQKTAMQDALYNRDERSWSGIAVYCGTEEVWSWGIIYPEIAKQRMQRLQEKQ